MTRAAPMPAILFSLSALWGERAGVRWVSAPRRGDAHLTLPSLTREAPPSPPSGRRGTSLRVPA
jgi:hypothetical protein